MKREARVAHVEASGWELDLFATGDYHRVELRNPSGAVVFVKVPCLTLAEVWEAVRTFLDGQRLGDTAVALREMARTEIRCSS